MNLSIVFLAFIISLKGYSSQQWPEQRQVLQGNIESISYLKEGKKFVKVAFLDADSNLRIAPSGKPSANSENDVQVLPCVGSRLKQLKEEGYLIAIVSNQGGISSKKVTFETANNALQETMRQSIQRNQSAFFHWYDFAEDYNSYFANDKKLNTFRKPGKGMALLLEEALSKMTIKIDKERSFMVGDSLFKAKLNELKPNGEVGIQFSNSDRCFSQNYGIRYFDPADFFGWNSNPLFETQFFDNKENGFNIEFYNSYPKNARIGGEKEVNFCHNLKSYKKYSSYIENKILPENWIASYQCTNGGCAKAFVGKTHCPKLQ